jgi:hypothetical protein
MKGPLRSVAILLALCAACAVHAEPLTVGQPVAAVQRRSPEYLRNQADLRLLAGRGLEVADTLSKETGS